MSIEAAIADHSAALRELAAAIRSAHGTAGVSAAAAAPTPAESNAARTKVAAGEPLTAGEAVAALHGHASPADDGETAEKAAAAAAAKAAKAAAAAEAKAAKAAAAAEAEAAAEARAAAEAKAAADAAALSARAAADVPYDRVREAILDVAAKHGRDAVLALLKPFGVERGQQLKPEQYAAALAAAKKVATEEPVA